MAAAKAQGEEEESRRQLRAGRAAINNAGLNTEDIMATQLLERFSTKKDAAPGTAQWLVNHIERGKAEPHAEVVSLNPGLAGLMLKANPDNRAIREVKVRHFAHDMRAGKWPLNGETIILSKEGLLNDGQHRLQAIVAANICVPATIFFGADRETRKTVDIGTARGAAAFLAMDGVPNAATRASIARMVLAFEDSDALNLNTAPDFTPIEIYERGKSDAVIGECAALAESRSARTKAYAAPRIIGFAYYAMRHIDDADADVFIDQITLGENLRRRDPAYAVRERLLSLGKNQGSDKIEVIFRGWNAYRSGRHLIIAKLMGGDLPALI